MKTTFLSISVFLLIIQNTFGQEEYHRINPKRTYPNINSLGNSADQIGNKAATLNSQIEMNLNFQQSEHTNNLIEEDFLVNDDGGNAKQIFSEIAMDSVGNFIIVWQDSRNLNDLYEVYYQLYNSAGIKQGNNRKANDTTSNSDYPTVAMGSDGNFVIAWSDMRNVSQNHRDIYFQRFNAEGIKNGINQKVNDDSGNANQGWPKIAIDKSNNFVMVWEDYRNGHNYTNPDIYFQRFDSSGSARGINLRVNDKIGNVGYPAVAMDKVGNFVITWQDNRNGHYDIYFQRYNSEGIAQGLNSKANDDQGSADQLVPSIAMGSQGNFIIAWRDTRNGEMNPDIYFQQFSSNGTCQGINQKQMMIQ